VRCVSGALATARPSMQARAGGATTAARTELSGLRCDKLREVRETLSRAAAPARNRRPHFAALLAFRKVRRGMDVLPCSLASSPYADLGIARAVQRSALPRAARPV
jgi:hypothetical protein